MKTTVGANEKYYGCATQTRCIHWLGSSTVTLVQESSLCQSETFPKTGQIDHDLLIDHLDHRDPNRTIQWLGSSSVAMVEESSLLQSVTHISADNCYPIWAQM